MERKRYTSIIIAAALMLVAGLACTQTQEKKEDGTGFFYQPDEQAMPDATAQKLRGFVNEIKIGEYEHTVVYGETLWSIAEKEYGNNFYWPFIYVLNEEALKNPDTILPGTNLTIAEIPKEFLADSRVPQDVPEEVLAGLSRAYYDIYIFYNEEGGRRNGKWMLYLADRFDKSYVEEKKNAIPGKDYTFIVEAREREGRALEE